MAGTVVRYPAVRWPEGVLELPSVEDLSDGYGVVAGAERAARAGWARVGAVAAANPTLALTLGVALAGPYMDPLRRESFVYVLAGGRPRAEAVAVRAAAAVFGDPTRVVRSWVPGSVSATNELGELACLPAFRDELDVTRLSAADLAGLILRITLGASREVARSGGGTARSGRWYGPLLVASAHSVLDTITYPAAAVRVVEVARPAMGVGPRGGTGPGAASAAAELVDHLVDMHYGWPLQWLLQAAVTTTDVARLLEQAQTDLDMAPGGIARTTAKHLAVGVVGAEVLERLLRVRGLRAAARDAAAGTLHALLGRLAEHGWVEPPESPLRVI